MPILEPNTWAFIGFLLNLVWFIYAQVNTRYVRQRIRRVEGLLLTHEPAIHADALEMYCRKKRDTEGLMLVEALRNRLHVKKGAKRSPKAPIAPQP